jgi:uncharacterized protein YmfQ (DUF2313 family)
MKRLDDAQLQAKLDAQLMSHKEANIVKDKLILHGFTYSISFYGVINNPETQKHEYRRVEVFMNTKPTQFNVQAIHNFFNELKPYFYYTIWAYNEQLKNIILIAGWD